MGFRHSAGPPPPDLPEYVAANIPTYTGDPIFPGAGREKWAHAPIIDAFYKTRKSLARFGIPLLLRWEISIAKSICQTLGESIAQLRTKSGTSPFRLPRRAYVEFASAESFA